MLGNKYQVNGEDPIDSDEQTDYVNIDHTELFLNKVGCHAYNSFEELQERVYKFEKLCGVLFRRGTCHKFPEETTLRKTVVYKSLIFVCVHYGTGKLSAQDSSLKSVHRLRTLNCRASFTAKGSTNGIRVTKYNLIHNHHISEEGSIHLERCRHLTENQTNSVVKLMALGTPNRIVKRFVNKNCNIRLSKKQVYSLKHRLKKKYLSLNQSDCVDEEQEGEIDTSNEKAYISTRIQDIAEMLKNKTSSLPFYLVDQKLHDLQTFAEKWVVAIQLEAREKFRQHEFAPSSSRYVDTSSLEESNSPFPMPLDASDADDTPQDIIAFNPHHLSYINFPRCYTRESKQEDIKVEDNTFF